MLSTLLIIFIVANLLVSLKGEKSTMLIFLTSIFIIFVFVGSRDMADWPNYVEDYKINDQGYANNGQILFFYINEIGRKLGLSFDEWRFVISVLGLFLYYRFVIYFSPLPNVVYAGYLSYLMFLDDVQIRNFLASAVFCIALSILIKHQKKWRLKYFIFLACASLIHNSFWIYLLFLFVPDNLENTRIVKIISIGGLILTIIVVFIRPFISNIVMLFSIIAGDKATGYAESEIGLGGLIYVVVHILSFFGVYYVLKKTDNSKSQYSKVKYNNSIKFLKITLLVDGLSFFILPTVILAMTFYRLIRNLFFINVIAFTIGMKYNKHAFISIVFYVVYIAIFANFDLNTEMGTDIIINPFFDNNIFF